MKGPRQNQRLFAKRSNAVVPVHLTFSARHFSATTSSVKYSRQWGWSIGTSLGQGLAQLQAHFGLVKGRFFQFLSTTRLNSRVQGVYQHTIQHHYGSTVGGI